MMDFLRQEGIIHELTGRHCSQSKGLAEKLNATIMEKMFIDAKLGTQVLLVCFILCSALLQELVTLPSKNTTSSPAFRMIFNY
jgi:hypothetical protein